jgi:hypothetical protein
VKSLKSGLDKKSHSKVKGERGEEQENHRRAFSSLLIFHDESFSMSRVISGKAKGKRESEIV